MESSAAIVAYPDAASGLIPGRVSLRPTCCLSHIAQRGLIRDGVEPVLTSVTLGVIAKESWIVGMEVVNWRYVP